MKILTLPTFATIVFTLIACSDTKLSTDDYTEAHWQQWKQKRDQSLASEEGWMSLVGLYWLSEGRHKIGSSADSDIVFPVHAPSSVGEIEVSDNGVLLRSATSEMLFEEDVFDQIQLTSDVPQKIDLGRYMFYLIEREKGLALRLIDRESELRKTFLATEFYPFDPKRVVQAKLIPHETRQKMRVATVYGTVREETSAGLLQFEIAGEPYQLEAVDYGEYDPESDYFVMYRDKTSGKETYGAGRYLYVERANENGMTIIDFNRTYNPPCAYTEFATCAIAPMQNHLPIAMEVGERNFNKH